jgi:hypothetical protein
VNVLESVGIVERETKNRYFWRGLNNVIPTLITLNMTNKNNDNTADMNKKGKTFTNQKNFIQLFVILDISKEGRRRELQT